MLFMSMTRRSAPSSMRRLLQQQPRRFDSHAAHGHDDHHHAGPVNEGLGVCFLSYRFSP